MCVYMSAYEANLMCVCVCEDEQTEVLFSQWVMEKVGCVTEASIISNLAT